MWRNHVGFKVTCFKPSDKMNLLPVLWFKSRRPGQALGSARVPHALFVKAERKSQRMFHAVCSPNDAVGADRSLHRLLLLYGATYSERDYEDEKMVSGVPKYTIDNSFSDSCEGLPIPELPDSFFFFLPVMMKRKIHLKKHSSHLLQEIQNFS
jgi:hypothetical protein